MIEQLRDRVAAVPDVEVPVTPELARAIDHTSAWLASDDAVAMVAADPYWPKWHGPWWGMVGLHELGAAARIPARMVEAMVDALAAMPVHTFPIRDDEWPPGVDRRRHSTCHCAIGCMDQVLAACGVDVDRVLPWVASWFERYQLADGGYNCDEQAYQVHGECPSSMVGTVPLFEAMVRRGPSSACDRAAAMLCGRRLIDGSETTHNAEERTAALVWSQPCLPRFYFYDVLRGAAALTRWAVTHGRVLPAPAIAPAIELLVARAGDGVVCIGRHAWRDRSTWIAEDGWTGRHPAVPSALVTSCGAIGEPSAALTRQWTQVRRDLRTLLHADRIVA